MYISFCFECLASVVPSADSLASLVCHAISQSSTRRVIPSLSQFVSQSPQSGPKMGEKPITVATGIQQTVDNTSVDQSKFQSVVSKIKEKFAINNDFLHL